jgi:hypothetical protein
MVDGAQLPGKAAEVGGVLAPGEAGHAADHVGLGCSGKVMRTGLNAGPFVV